MQFDWGSLDPPWGHVCRVPTCTADGAALPRARPTIWGIFVNLLVEKLYYGARLICISLLQVELANFYSFVFSTFYRLRAICSSFSVDFHLSPLPIFIWSFFLFRSSIYIRILTLCAVSCNYFSQFIFVFPLILLGSLDI